MDFLAGVFAGGAEGVLWRGQRCSSAQGSEFGCAASETLVACAVVGACSVTSFTLCYFVTSSWNARKALSLFRGGEEHDKFQNIGVGQCGTPDASGICFKSLE